MAAHDQFDEAEARPSQRLSGRELRVEAAAAALFVLAATAAAAFLPSTRPLAVGVAIALTALYAVASRVEFPTGVGTTVPTQIVLAPMLFLLPTPAVPLFVAAGLLLGRLPSYVLGRTPAERAIVELGDALHALGPAIVLSLAGADTPALDDWPLYVLAFASQVAGDVTFSTLRAWLGLGAPPRVVAREVAWIAVADFVLTPVGFVAALAALEQPYAFVLLLPLLAILALSAHDRRMRFQQGKELWSAYRGSVLLLDRVVGADDRLTGEHGRGVVDLAMRVGDELGVDEHGRVELEFSALLHDVGKLAIDNEIINKRGPLTPEEFTVIKTHTVEGHRMLAELGGLLGEVGVIVRACHERWDGAGYPDGLAGEAIPLTARIVFCCDAYHAMTTDRSYRAARSPERALAEIHANSGTQFDPTVVAALTHVLTAAPGAGDGHRARRGAQRALKAWHTERPALASDEGLVGLTPDGAVHSMNSAAVRLLGWSAEEAVGQSLHELAHHSYPSGAPYPRAASPIEAALGTQAERANQVEVFWRKDGAPLPVRYTLRPASDGGSGAVLAFKPLVARSPAEEALRLGEELYRSLARNLPGSAVILFDHDLRVLVFEGEPLDDRPLDHGELSRRRLEDVLPAYAWAALERAARDALRGDRAAVDLASDDGSRVHHVAIGPVRDDQGAVQAGLAVAEDVTETRQHTEQLDRRANYDDLTGLTNRASFYEVADTELRRAARTHAPSALLFIDLDGLKAVNDTRGHEVGDAVLRAVAASLKGSVRDVDTVARLGGDEFAVLLSGVQDEAEAGAAAERILRAVAAPLEIGANGSAARVTASVGIAVQSAPGETGADLMRAADAAMYRAKGLGGNRMEFFRPGRGGAAARPGGGAPPSIAHAIERGELTVHYQPEVDLRSDEVVAVEALVRWRHPERGLLAADAFLAEAERCGAIDAIDEWVIGEAAAQAMAWSGAGLPPFRITVNVSGRHVGAARFADTVRQSLATAGLPADRLRLEIPERNLPDLDAAGEHAMRALRGDGTRISIDHFGTEGSRVDRLKAFPVDGIKIDRRFVRSLPEDPRIATGAIALAHSLGLDAIAGGVETDEELDILRGSGCDVAAGHLISEPVPPDQLSAWMRARMRRRQRGAA